MRLPAFVSRVTDRLYPLVERYTSRPYRLFGLAVTRVLVGFAGVLYYLGDYGDRALLRGPDAVVSYDRFQGYVRYGSPIGFSVYELSRDPRTFEILFHLGLLIAVAFTIFGGRLLAALHGVFLISALVRAPLISDGGDNLTRIIILFMPLAITSAYLSPLGEFVRTYLERRPSAIRSVFHNTAVLLIVFQTCLVYLLAALWKISGPHWQHGIAMGTVMSSTQFGLVSAIRPLFEHPIITTIATYMPVLGQLLFAPFVLFVPRLRAIAVLVIAGMHLGIMSFMGLVTFGIVMIGADATCLGEKDFAHGLLSKWRRLPEADPPTSIKAVSSWW